MTTQETRDIIQRLARLEEAVTNHIPGRIAQVESAIHALDSRIWGLVVGVSGTLIFALASLVVTWIRR